MMRPQMSPVARSPLPDRLLASLDDATRAPVGSADASQAAAAMLDLIEAIPPFSSRVVLRSA